MISAEELAIELRESDDSLENILINHGLSLKTAYELNGKAKRVKSLNDTKGNVYFEKKAYVVKKESKFDGGYKSVFYGRYKTRKEAEAIVEELKKCDWDKNRLCDIQEELEIYEWSTVPSKTGYYKVLKRHGGFLFKDLKSDTIKGLHRLMHDNGYTLKKCPLQKR